MTRINLQNRIYFLTSVTYERKKFFTSEGLAKIVKDQWKHYEEEFNFDLQAFAILPDHYHVLIELGDEEDISEILYAVNSYSAKLINEKLEGEEYEKIWRGNIYDEVIRSKKMYFQKLAYVLFNPWRAGLVDGPFIEYRFSNLDEWVESRGKDFVEDLFSKFRRWGE